MLRSLLRLQGPSALRVWAREKQTFASAARAQGMVKLASVQLRSYHKKFIQDCVQDVQDNATKMGLHATGIVALPTRTRKWSMLKAPFKYKKHFRQFQHDTHKRLIEFYGHGHVGQDTTNVVHFLRYLEHTILILHPGCWTRVMLYADEAPIRQASVATNPTLRIPEPPGATPPSLSRE